MGERLHLIYGGGYRLVDMFLGDSKNDNGFAVSFDDNHRDTHLFSGFLQGQIPLVKEKLELTVGSKLEHNSFTGFEIQPTGRLLWTPTKWHSCWTSVSRAVRTPNFVENEAAVTLPGFTTATGVTIFPRLVSNTDFKSENVVMFEGGYRAQPIDKLSFDLALFLNLYDNLKVTVPGTVTVDPTTGVNILSVQPQNVMDGKTYGLELGVNGQPTDWWHLYGAYTILKMQLNPDANLAASTQTSANAQEGQSPEHQIFLQSSFDLPHHFELDLIGRFVSSLSGFNPSGIAGFSDTIDQYFSLDTRLGWKPVKNLGFEVVGQNLLSDHHAEVGANPTVRNPLVEIARSVYGKVTWQF